MLEKPIIIVGVPRSGTTLLRVLLGEHPEIVALPETPWITGSQNDPSLRDFLDHLMNGKKGPVKSWGDIESSDIFFAGRAFLDEIFGLVVKRVNKNRYCIKTPDDIMYLEFLMRLYPDAKWIHIKRDPRDVALSTVRAKNQLLGKKLFRFGANNMTNALRRWLAWEQKISNASQKDEASWHHITYEDLVAKPDQVMKSVYDFLELPTPQDCLKYDSKNHLLPEWEQGSHDVKMQSGQIQSSKQSQWKRNLSLQDALLIHQLYGRQFAEHGYPSIDHDDEQSAKRSRNLFSMTFVFRETCDQVLHRIKCITRIPELICKSFCQIVIDALTKK